MTAGSLHCKAPVCVSCRWVVVARRCCGFCDHLHFADAGQTRSRAFLGLASQSWQSRVSGSPKHGFVPLCVWYGCPLRQGSRRYPQSWRWPGDRSSEASTPRAEAAATYCPHCFWIPGLEGSVGSCCPHTHTQPGRWMEGPRAQMPQCLGRDYPAGSTCHVWWRRASVAHPPCPLFQRGLAQAEQLSLVPALPSPGTSSMKHRRLLPSGISHLPEEQHFCSLG